MAPPQDSTSASSSSSPSPPDANADELIMGYTPTQLKVALNSINGPNAEVTCKHIFGYGNDAHELSMLQKVTAVRILDYEKMVAEESTPTIPDLINAATQFQTSHGPILNLLTVVQSKSPSMSLAGEFKRASPSKGDINPGINAGEQAAKYAAAGASAISVLTEPNWFKGGLDDLTAARLSTTGNANYDRPAILRKEFVFGTYQIYEAAAHGADTILLIVAVTPADLLKTLIDTCRSIGMEPLVEVHGDDELDVALQAGAAVIGVNNRNLHNFRMDLGTTERTAAELVKRHVDFNHDKAAAQQGGGEGSGGDEKKKKPDHVLCSLSGMSSSGDVDRYRRIGVGMCLIGESLMRAANPGAAIAGLCLDPVDYEKQMLDASAAAGAYTGGTKIVKVCGVTDPNDALVACQAGANLIGVIFVPKSKRCVTPEQAASVVGTVREFGERSGRIDVVQPDNVGKMSPLQSLVVKSRALEEAARRPLVVGVFQNQSPEFIRDMVERCGLDMVQLHGKEGMEAASVANCGVPALRVVDIETGGGGGGEGADDDDGSAGAVRRILDSITTDPAAILLDTSIKGSKDGGGTGVTFDWGIAESIQNSGLPVIIAGGLKPDNVKDAVTKTRPWGIDVSSGVEESPGKKDPDAVKSFVGGARQAALEASKGF